MNELYRIKSNGQSIEHVAGNEGYDKHGWKFMVYTELDGCKKECEWLEEKTHGGIIYEPELIRLNNILTQEQIKQMEEASKPLIKFLNENCNPHTKVIVETDRSEIVSGLAMVKIEEFIKD
jgi:hypothetical protein